MRFVTKHTFKSVGIGIEWVLLGSTWRRAVGSDAEKVGMLVKPAKEIQ